MTFDILFDLERELADYTHAPFVVMTDGCTHAIELVMRWYGIKSVEFTAFTYLSIPQTMTNLSIQYNLTDEQWTGEYKFHGTNIWDSARRLEPGMYRKDQIQCLSFGHGKPISVGHCGAILLDDAEAFYHLSRMRSDGRDLSISPWINQTNFGRGWHYCPILEAVTQVRNKLRCLVPQCQKVSYPDCRKILFSD